MEVAHVGGVPPHAEIGAAVAHCARDVEADARVQVDTHGGVCGHEGADVVGELFCQHRRGRHDADDALHAGGEVGEFGVQPLHRAQYMARLAQQGQAGGDTPKRRGSSTPVCCAPVCGPRSPTPIVTNMTST